MTPLVRKLAIALAISVALNLFGFGFLAARALQRHGRDGLRPAARERGGLLHEPGRPFGPGPVGLSKAGREAMRAHRGALKDAQAAVANALRAEPFDRGALEHALAELRARQGAAAEAAHAALVELAAKLDAPGRRALAERGPGRRGR